MRQQNIFRKRKEKNFTQICNQLINDPRISWGATAILIYALSKPDDWDLYISEIAKQRKDGRTKISWYFRELREAGYFKQTHIRDEKGHIVKSGYLISEEPEHRNPINLKRPVKTRNAGNPIFGKPEISKPINRKPDTTNTYLNKEGIETNSTESESDSNSSEKFELISDSKKEKVSKVRKEKSEEEIERKIISDKAFDYFKDLAIKQGIEFDDSFKKTHIRAHIELLKKSNYNLEKYILFYTVFSKDSFYGKIPCIPNAVLKASNNGLSKSFKNISNSKIDEFYARHGGRENYMRSLQGVSRETGEE